MTTVEADAAQRGLISCRENRQDKGECCGRNHEPAVLTCLNMKYCRYKDDGEEEMNHVAFQIDLPIIFWDAWADYLLRSILRAILRGKEFHYVISPAQTARCCDRVLLACYAFSRSFCLQPLHD